MARKLLQASNEDQINLLAINAGGSTIPYTGDEPIYVVGQNIGIYPSAISKWNGVDSKLSQDTWNNTTASFATKVQINELSTNIDSINSQVTTNTQTIADHTSNIEQFTNDINDIHNTLSAIEDIEYDIDELSGKLDNKLNVNDINVDVENNKITSINVYGEPIPIGESIENIYLEGSLNPLSNSQGSVTIPTVVTGDEGYNGLMSTDDKTKLDNITMFSSDSANMQVTYIGENKSSGYSTFIGYSGDNLGFYDLNVPIASAIENPSIMEESANWSEHPFGLSQELIDTIISLSSWANAQGWTPPNN